MDEHSDAALLATWRGGDQEAFAVLVARHHGLVQAACARQAAPGEVDDCVQAVFLVLSRRPSAAARVPSLAAWLQRVASFVCRHSRRAAERRRRAERAAAEVQAVPAVPPAEALGHLDDCLLRLPEKQRLAVVMHYLAGRSSEDVAASLGTSPGNARQLLSRGVAGLRTLLARRGVALAPAALVGLLAGEAQAATVPAQVATITALATASPSAGAVALATGTITTMTITSLAPIAACVAGLLLTASVATVVLSAEPPPPPAPTVQAPAAAPAGWPAEGVPLPEPVPAASSLLRWSPENRRILMAGRKDLFLVTPQGVIPLGLAGRTDPYHALGRSRWLANGRIIIHGGFEDGLKPTQEGIWSWQDGTMQELMPLEPGNYTTSLSPDRSVLAIVRHHQSHAAQGAWLLRGTEGLQPLLLPVPKGQVVAELDWDAAGRLVARSIPVEQVNFPHMIWQAQRWTSADMGATWSDGGASPDRPSGPFPLGSLSTFDPAAGIWTVPGGGTLAAIPVADAAPPAIPPEAKEVQARRVSALVLRDAAGAEVARYAWTGEDMPWPVALTPGRDLLVALHRRLRFEMGDPWSVWEVVPTGWAILPLAGGALRPLDVRLGNRDSILLFDGRKVVIQARLPGSASALWRVEPGVAGMHDLGSGLMPAPGWAAGGPGTSPAGLGSAAAALLLRPQVYVKAPGPRLLVAWNGSSEPIILHRSTGLEDAAANLEWSPDGRCLAWIQGGRLRVWEH